MKKLAILGTTILSFLAPMQTFAQSINIDRPNQGFVTIGNFISNALTLAFAIAVIIVLIMLIIGAYEWITSGGDKDAVGKARNRIINALIGLAVLAVAFALARLIGQFTNVNIFNLVVPTPDNSDPGTRL